MWLEKVGVMTAESSGDNRDDGRSGSVRQQIVEGDAARLLPPRPRGRGDQTGKTR
jgi:hypothetical protein